MSRVDDLLGRALGGRYRILSRLGAGASATVYLAEDAVLGRLVAVKVLHPALASDEGFLRRFQSEARAAARLRHANIVQVYDWGEDPAGVYVVLEHLAGGNLRQVLDRAARLDLSQVARLGAEAAQGLAHAHERGTAHRDIKPANLLFDEQGQLAIADFGLARAMADATWTEPAGVILGTARYASPEQATGQPTTLATDVYSLALVLVEAATGSVPFSADTTVATLMARQGRRVEPSPELGELGPIVAAATDPDPAARPGSAWLSTELVRLLGSLPPPRPLPRPGPGRDSIGSSGFGPDDVTPSLAGPGYRPGRRPGGPEPETEIGAAPPAGAAELTRPEHLRADPRPDPPPEGPGRARRRPGRLGLALGAALVVLLGVGLWLALAVFKLNVPSHPIPKVAGETLLAAENQMRADHFPYRVLPAVFSETVGDGDVLGQSPAPGGMARQGTPMTLLPSKGPAPRAVPDLGGLDRASAASKLQAAGFASKFVGSYSETASSGTVLTWSPSSGQQAKGSLVTITLSSGPRPRTVPSLAQQSYQSAAAALTNLGLHPAEVQAYSTSVPSGSVISTDPGAGATVARGSTVTITVSKGPQMVAVPDVSGDSVTEATGALQAAGLAVGNVYGPPHRGRVFITDPSAGAQVVVGSSVDLYTM